MLIRVDVRAHMSPVRERGNAVNRESPGSPDSEVKMLILEQKGGYE